MKIIDKCTLRNKHVEKLLRNLDGQVDILTTANTLNKDAFISVFVLTMELLIEAFKSIEDNTTPAKTLLDFTGAEIKDACFRVGDSKIFDNDPDYVIAVMQELTK